jgi:hypothetical protein
MYHDVYCGLFYCACWLAERRGGGPAAHRRCGACAARPPACWCPRTRPSSVSSSATLWMRLPSAISRTAPSLMVSRLSHRRHPAARAAVSGLSHRTTVVREGACGAALSCSTAVGMAAVVAAAAAGCGCGQTAVACPHAQARHCSTIVYWRLIQCLNASI